MKVIVEGSIVELLDYGQDLERALAFENISLDSNKEMYILTKEQHNVIENLLYESALLEEF